MIKTIHAITIASILLLGSISFAIPAQAAPIWSATGPATTVTDPDIGDGDHQAEFKYNLSPAGFSTRTWSFTTVATSTGPVTLDYQWSGSHAFFRVTTFLQTVDSSGTTTIVSQGPVNCCSPPSFGFNYVGQVTLNTVAGQPYGFNLGGSNFDSNNFLRGTLTIETPNNAPDCSAATPSQDTLWPPNHKMNDISINGITDSDGDAVTVTVDSITQDEPTNGLGDGDQSPDGDGVGTDTAQVRAERSGLGDGRVYEISFTADDGFGGSCSGSVQVGVPHDKKDTAIDSGQTVDSTS